MRCYCRLKPHGRRSNLEVNKTKGILLNNVSINLMQGSYDIVFAFVCKENPWYRWKSYFANVRKSFRNKIIWISKVGTACFSEITLPRFVLFPLWIHCPFAQTSNILLLSTIYVANHRSIKIVNFFHRSFFSIKPCTSCRFCLDCRSVH